MKPSVVGTLIVGLWLFTTASYAAPTTPSQTPSTPEEIKARELVQNLGHPNFKVRETAARQLLQMGRPARKALLEGRNSNDAEVWNRCQQLLPRVNELELRARIDSFLADKDGKQTHDLPLWDRYQKIAGADQNARKLFAEMLQVNSTLLDQVVEEPALAGERYSIKVQELQNHLNFGWRTGRQPTLNVADVATLFLIGADARTSEGIVANPQNPVGNFLWQPNIQNTLRGGDYSIPFRKLFLAWGEYQTDINSVSQILSVIQNLNLKEGLALAVKAVQMKDLQIWTRGQAITCVGRMGGKEHVALLETSFTDTSSFGTIQWNNVQITTNAGDAALAMAIHLNGQQVKDYGFDALATQPSLMWSYNYLGFSTDARRSNAFLKLANSKDFPASTRASALIAAGRFGDEKIVAKLVEFLKDTTEVSTVTSDGKKHSIQLRDAALAAAVTATKQDAGSYGFKAFQVKEPPKNATLKDYYFASNEDRENAMKKWSTWLTENPIKNTPKK